MKDQIIAEGRKQGNSDNAIRKKMNEETERLVDEEISKLMESSIEQMFLYALSNEYSVENYNFLVDLNLYNKIKDKGQKVAARDEIVKKYALSGNRNDILINIGDDVFREFQSQKDFTSKLDTIFDKAQEEIVNLLRRDSFPRLVSDWKGLNTRDFAEFLFQAWLKFD